MSKSIKIILGSIVGLAAILILVLMFSINSIVKSGIEDFGSEMTGTEVTVSSVSISPFSGRGTVKGFRVANPDGYSQSNAIEVEDFSIRLEPFSLFSNTMIVNEINISAPAIYVEQKLPENNMNTLLQNIQSVSSGETSDAELVIEHFVMTNATADLYTEVGGERSAKVEISSVELHDLGRGGGREAVEDVITEIAENVAEEALKGAAQSGEKQLRDAIEDIFN